MPVSTPVLQLGINKSPVKSLDWPINVKVKEERKKVPVCLSRHVSSHFNLITPTTTITGLLTGSFVDLNGIIMLVKEIVFSFSLRMSVRRSVFNLRQADKTLTVPWTLSMCVVMYIPAPAGRSPDRDEMATFGTVGD
jgi:hypothetical protein